MTQDEYQPIRECPRCSTGKLSRMWEFTGEVYYCMMCGEWVIWSPDKGFQRYARKLRKGSTVNYGPVKAFREEKGEIIYDEEY